MLQVIAAIFGMGTSANQGAQAQYQAQQAAYQQSLQYSEGKENAYFSAFTASTKQLTTIAIIGFAFIMILLYIATRK